MLSELEQERVLRELAPAVLGSTGNLSWLRGPCGMAWLRAAGVDAEAFIRQVYEIAGRAAPVPLLLEECVSAEHPRG